MGAGTWAMELVGDKTTRSLLEQEKVPPSKTPSRQYSNRGIRLMSDGPMGSSVLSGRSSAKNMIKLSPPVRKLLNERVTLFEPGKDMKPRRSDQLIVTWEDEGGAEEIEIL